jgi:phage tail tape-measure protein
MLDTAGFSKGLDSAMGSLNGLVAMAAAVEAALVGTFTAAAAEGLRFAAELEQLDIAFTTFLGSAEKSAAFLDEMKQFAAQTPFAFEDVVRGTQRLMAMGFAAEDSIPVLAAVGDRISALGKGGAEIDRVIRALGQMSGKGKVFTQEMNQLNEVGRQNGSGGAGARRKPSNLGSDLFKGVHALHGLGSRRHDGAAEPDFDGVIFDPERQCFLRAGGRLQALS